MSKLKDSRTEKEHEMNTFRLCAYLPQSMRKKAEAIRALLQSYDIYATIEDIEEMEE